MNARKLMLVALAVVSLGPSVFGGETDRSFWSHKTGYYQQQDGSDWREGSQNGIFELQETERTAQYVELVSKSGTGTRIRLHDSHTQLLRNGKGDWQRRYEGGWGKPPTAKDRVYWLHKGGFFDSTGGGNWYERSPNGIFQFVEAARTGDFVELQNPKTGTRVRLYEDRCEVRGAEQQSFSSRYRGAWAER
jgi:hypothetical protein